MNGKCEIHRNRTWPVFNGPQHCVKVWKDLVERYFNYYPETKNVTDGRMDMRIPIYRRLSSSGGIPMLALQETAIQRDVGEVNIIFIGFINPLFIKCRLQSCIKWKYIIDINDI
jgi:hypothetical protein